MASLPKYGIDAASIVIPGEDPAELQALIAEYFDDLHPEGPLQRFLVETMIHAQWSKRRFARVEAELLRSLLPGGSCETLMEDRTLQRVHRRLQSLDRTYFRALAELRRAQRQERTVEEPSQPARPEVPVSASNLHITRQIHAIGFVPSISARQAAGSAPLAGPPLNARARSIQAGKKTPKPE